MGVGNRFGDDEVEVSGTAVANSSSAGMAGGRGSGRARDNSYASNRC